MKKYWEDYNSCVVISGFTLEPTFTCCAVVDDRMLMKRMSQAVMDNLKLLLCGFFVIIII